MLANGGRDAQTQLGATLARGLGTLEMEILDVVWCLGRATSREVFEKMRERRRLGQPTVLTVLRRLSNRGILIRETEDSLYVYSPAIGRDELGGRMIDNLIALVFRGALEPVVDHLMSREKMG